MGRGFKRHNECVPVDCFTTCTFASFKYCCPLSSTSQSTSAYQFLVAVWVVVDRTHIRRASIINWAAFSGVVGFLFPFPLSGFFREILSSGLLSWAYRAFPNKTLISDAAAGTNRRRRLIGVEDVYYEEDEAGVGFT